MEQLTRILAVFMLLAGWLAGCGGSGDDDLDFSAPPPDDEGTVAVFLTDAETDRFNEILVTFDSIVLIAGEGDEEEQAVVVDEAFTVDLRKLTDFSEFVGEASVEAGTYEKIRLQVSEVVLREVDDVGNLLDSRSVPVPSGKIDLNPRASFEVEAGEQTIALIDFDAANSFLITQTGNGQFRLRPVVFVRIVDGAEPSDDPGRLVRQHGQITMLDVEDNAFSLCNITLLSADQGAAPASDECVDVKWDAGTVIYNSQLAGITEADLVENGEVTVLGHLERGDEGAELDAVVLVEGPVDTLAAVRATVTEEPDADGVMTVDVAPGQEDLEAGQRAVVLAEDVLVVSRDDGRLLDVGALTPETRVLLVGQPDTDTGEFRAVAVSVADEQDEISGNVTAIADRAGGGIRLDLSTADGDACVIVTTDTNITLDDGSDAVTEGAISDVAEGVAVSAQGDTDGDGCVFATTLVVTVTSE